MSDGAWAWRDSSCVGAVAAETCASVVHSRFFTKAASAGMLCCWERRLLARDVFSTPVRCSKSSYAQFVPRHRSAFGRCFRDAITATISTHCPGTHISVHTFVAFLEVASCAGVDGSSLLRRRPWQLVSCRWREGCARASVRSGCGRARACAYIVCRIGRSVGGGHSMCRDRDVGRAVLRRTSLV